MDLNKPELSALAEIESTEHLGQQVFSLDECALALIGGGVGEVIFN